MKSYILAFLFIGALSACSNDQLHTACVIDGVAQPIVVAVGSGLANATGYQDEAADAAKADAKVHAAVQAACAALHGTPVVVAPGSPIP